MVSYFLLLKIRKEEENKKSKIGILIMICVTLLSTLITTYAKDNALGFGKPHMEEEKEDCSNLGSAYIVSAK